MRHEQRYGADQGWPVGLGGRHSGISITTQHHLILTRTPLQNNLPELWVLLNPTLPKIFNSVKSFNTPFANYGTRDEMEVNEDAYHPMFAQGLASVLVEAIKEC